MGNQRGARDEDGVEWRKKWRRRGVIVECGRGATMPERERLTSKSTMARVGCLLGLVREHVRADHHGDDGETLGAASSASAEMPMAPPGPSLASSVVLVAAPLRRPAPTHATRILKKF